MIRQSQLSILITREEIEQTVVRLAHEVESDYQGKHPLLVGVLKGSFVFMADLIRHLDMPLELDFIKVCSYCAGQESPGIVRLMQDLGSPVEGRDVLVIEDIVDTGSTISFVLDHLRKGEPGSLKLCALTDKPSRRRVRVSIDYVGLTVPDAFIVGYGLDCDERFRNLPDICVLES